MQNTNTQKWALKNLNIASKDADFLETIKSVPLCYGNVYQQAAGGVIKNWINNYADGSYIKIGYLCIAVNGWNVSGPLYYHYIWGDKWVGDWKTVK